MDSLDLFLAVSTAAVVVAALLFPINRDDRGAEEKKDPQKGADASRKNPKRKE